MQEEMNFTIRPARPKEADKLTDIALAAKRHWGYPEEWMALWLSELECTPEFVSKDHVCCAEVNGDLAGFYSVIEDNGIWSVEDFWVHPTHMGCGIGRRLFLHAVDFVAESGGKTLRVVSDPNAESFYVKMGARRIGYVSSKPEGRQLPLLEVTIKEKH